MRPAQRGWKMGRVERRLLGDGGQDGGQEGPPLPHAMAARERRLRVADDPHVV